MLLSGPFEGDTGASQRSVIKHTVCGAFTAAQLSPMTTNHRLALMSTLTQQSHPPRNVAQPLQLTVLGRRSLAGFGPVSTPDNIDLLFVL